ncbi:hypothetical protein [Rheinheimera sp. 4Y26]|uniref:hypothetical protein n=1 Tax=Rheinheimera sp. 4Y26 TaxID=2977811 RepID=UPI0021B14F08|nr:hypothetical protein [Rheinheimera sp. 4Y26]MCT6700218.1 hypothetical protein [Rheinheimera sp. 4Y26]
MQQAEKAEQQRLISQALPLYQQAAALGHTAAVAAVFRLQQHSSKVLLGQWLAELPADASALAPYWAELGHWQRLTPDQQQQFQRPFAAITLQTEACRLSVLPVVTGLAEARQWQLLLHNWQQDPQLGSLPICWLPPRFIDSMLLQCSEQPTQRIQCDLPALQQQMRDVDFHQLLVLAGRGGASYNNGVLQLPEQSDLALLRHEFSHAFGFLDEYALMPKVAKDECKPGRLTANLLFHKADLAAYQQHWQLDANELELTPVASCHHAGLQAYRLVAADTHMQHYELAMPALYLKLLHKQLARPEQLMPAAYYFAYLARQQQDWPAWQHWMQQAAKLGYRPAQQALVIQNAGQQAAVAP